MANLGAFVGKIETFLNDISRLEVTTVVGDFKLVYNENSKKWEPQPGAGPLEGIQTNINLFQGDLWTAMHSDYSGSGDAAVRTFHQSQVDKAQGIVDGNIRAFKEIVQLLASARQSNSLTHEIEAAKRRLTKAKSELAAKPDDDERKKAVIDAENALTELEEFAKSQKNEE